MLFSAAAAASGTGTVVAIGLDIYAVNNFTGPAAAAHTSLRSLQSEFKRTMYENLRAARNMYGGMAAAGAVLFRGMGRLYGSFVDFDYIMKGTQIISQATKEQFGDIRREALRLGETTMFYADDIGNAMREMAKAGMPVNDILNNIRAAVAGAGATMEDLNTSTRAIISTLAQFQIPSENAMDVMDKLVAATTGAKNTMPQLSDALKYSAADFYALQIPLETALGMLMTMHNFGIEGSMAGTAMGNALRYMSKAMSDLRTSRQSQALNLFGMTEKDFATAEGDFKEMTEIFDMLMGRVRELGTIEGQVAMEALFGIRGKRAAFPMAVAAAKTAENAQRVANSQGMAAEYLEQMMATSKGQYIMMKSAWQTARISLGEGMRGTFDPLYMTLRKIAQGITWISAQTGEMPWLKTFMGAILSGTAAFLGLQTVIFAVKAVVAGLGMVISNNRISFSNMSKSMATGWAMLKAKALGYKGVVDGLVVSQARLASTMLTTVKGQRALVGSQAGAFGIAHMNMATATRKGSIHQYPLYRFSDRATRKSYHRGTPLPRGMGQAYPAAQSQIPGQFINNPAVQSVSGKAPIGGPILLNAQSRKGPGMAVAASEATKKGVMGALGRLGIGKILGKLGAFLMGPWGILAFIALPPLIQGISRLINRNTEAVRNNTKTQEEQNNILRGHQAGSEFARDYYDYSRVYRRLLENLILEQKIAKGELKPHKDTEVIVKFDGFNYRTTIGSGIPQELIHIKEPRNRVFRNNPSPIIINQNPEPERRDSMRMHEFSDRRFESRKTEVVFNVDGKTAFSQTLNNKLNRQVFEMGIS